MINNIRAVVRIIRQISYVLLPTHKRRLLPLFIVMIITVWLELMGVTIILPFVEAILSPDIVMTNKLIGPILRGLNINNSRDMLVFIGLCIILLYIVKNLFQIYSAYFQNDYSTTVEKDLSIKMIHAYMAHPYPFFLKTSTAEITRGCEGDVAAVYSTLNYFFTILTELFSFLAIGGFIFLTEPFIATGVLLLLIITMLALILLFKPITKRLGKKNLVAITEKNKALYHITQGIKDIFVFDSQTSFVGAYEKAADKVRKTQRNYTFMSAVPDRIVEGICVSGMLGIIVLRLLMNNDMVTFIPKMAVFAMAAFKMMPSIGKITSRINSIVYMQPRIEGIYENMKAAEVYEKECRSDKYLTSLSDYKEDREVDPLVFKKELVLRGVEWKYEEANKATICGLDLTIDKGDSIALIGESGAGKTTLADIILGLYRPQNGEIQMDGVDIFSVPHEWSQIVGYVPQTVFLIDDTIKANIAFGKNNIDDDVVWNVLEQASLAEFVRGLPEQLNTIVGERGIKFSGGQRQRIAIARALFASPEILVLDEATSALDSETENTIMETIEKLQGKMTLIIIAHRLTTIRKCNHIYEIKDGIALKRTRESLQID